MYFWPLPLIYSIVPPGELDPKLELKNRLNNAERLYIGEAIGAESFASYNGKLYSTVVGGYVVRLEEGRVVPIVKLGEKCGKFNLVFLVHIHDP